MSTSVESLPVALFRRGFFPVSLALGIVAMSFILKYQLPPELGTLGIPVLSIILIAIAERILPFDASWNKPMGDIPADLSSLAVVAFGLEPIFKAIGPGLVVMVLSWMSLPPTWHIFPVQWPFWAQCLLVILFIELVKYWFHRINHENPYWWRLHSVHHAVKRLYWLNGFRIHPVYHVLTYLLGYFPCILAGAPPETLMMHVVVLGICGGFQHCNIQLNHGIFNYIFSTNEMHRWHHSPDLAEGNKNYGAILIIYDLIFGTWYNVPGKSPVIIGFSDEEYYPRNNYWAQLLIPFWWRHWIPAKPEKPEQPKK